MVDLEINFSAIHHFVEYPNCFQIILYIFFSICTVFGYKIETLLKMSTLIYLCDKLFLVILFAGILAFWRISNVCPLLKILCYFFLNKYSSLLALSLTSCSLSQILRNLWNCQVQPQFQRSWDILLNAIKSRICHLLILFNFYLIDKSTEKKDFLSFHWPT